MQEVKTFTCKLYDPNWAVPVDEQINYFLKTNPTYTAKSISVLNGSNYQQAFVIFDIQNVEKYSGSTIRDNTTTNGIKSSYNTDKPTVGDSVSEWKAKNKNKGATKQ